MSNKNTKIKISGMHCSSCALNLEDSLSRMDGVNEAKVNFSSNNAEIDYDSDRVNIADINKNIRDLGYDVQFDEVSLKIEGMHCASCSNNVERFLKKKDGIADVNVNLSMGKALVLYDKNLVSIDEMGETIEELGFEFKGVISKIDVDSDEKAYKKDLEDKKSRLIVGFAFSAILMILMHVEINLPISKSLLSLIIAIIPFIYVTKPILSAGFNSLRHFNLDMDLMYSMGIMVALISSLMGTFNILLDSSFMFYDTTLMLASFLTLGRYLEARAKKQTSSSIKKLIGLQPKTAILIENSQEKEVLIENIKLGDILLVKPGDKIPTDAVVVEGESYIDESMINGEPIPKSKKYKDKVFAGTVNQNGVLKIKATSIGEDTLLSQIINLVDRAQSSKPPVQRFADTVVRYFIPAILTIAIFSFIVWNFILGATLLFSVTIFISILVIACPCALGLASPTAVTVGLGRGAEFGILIKDGKTLEASGEVSVVIFDKTGTITEGKPQIEDVFSPSKDELMDILFNVEKNSTHPIAKAIVKKAEEYEISNLDVTDFKNQSGMGLSALVSNKEVLIGNKSLMDINNIELSSEVLDKFLEYENMGKTTILCSDDGEFLGIITLNDKIKDNSKEAIAELKTMGISTYMVTGDNSKTADIVGEKVGIEHILAEALPEDKLNEVKRLQDKGENVLFVGDGINDAPALSQANTGVAIGSGTDIAMESGDVVLIDGDLEDVVASIELSQKVLRRIKENIFWAFAYNIVLVPIAAGILYPIVIRPEFAALAMALSSVTVISLSLMLKRYVPPIKQKSIS